MARPAPAVDRAVEILDFLADNPRDAFSLSELARRLDLNKASAHATLNALTDRGYLLRHPTRKDYRLGPRLIAVGEAAREQYPVVEFARDELRRLSEDLGTECVASAPIGDEMVIVDRAGPVRPIGLTVAVGYRFPLVPPMGTVFMAWSSPEEIDEWLRRVGPDVTEAELDRYRLALAAVRERGYSAGLDADGSRSLAEAQAGDLDGDEYQLHRDGRRRGVPDHHHRRPGVRHRGRRGPGRVHPRLPRRPHRRAGARRRRAPHEGHGRHHRVHPWPPTPLSWPTATRWPWTARTTTPSSGLFVPAIQDKVRASLVPAVERLGVTVLSVTTQTVDLVDDDHATGVVYCTGEIEDPDEGWIRQQIVYQDRYERVDGQWYFRARDHQLVYGERLPTNPLAQPPANWPTHQTGRGTYPPRSGPDPPVDDRRIRVPVGRRSGPTMYGRSAALPPPTKSRRLGKLMPTLLSAVAALAGRQHGLVTTPQVMDLGGTRHVITHMVACGQWDRVTPMLLRRVGSPRSRGQTRHGGGAGCR